MLIHAHLLIDGDYCSISKQKKVDVLFFKSADHVSIKTSAVAMSDAADEEPENISEFVVRSTAGVGAGPNHFFDTSFGSDDLNGIPASEVADCVGEWLLIAERRKVDCSEFIAFGDEYGYCPLFYALVPGHAIVISDSFYGIRAALVDYGIEPSLDVDNYMATVTAKSVHFANPTVRRTMAAEISILSMDEALLIGAEGVRKINRSGLGNAHRVTSFEEAVDLGIDFIGDSLQTLADTFSGDKTLFLSGGVDSRLLLALAKSAGVSEKFLIRSADPRNFKSAYSRKVVRDDILISDTIRRDLGLSWWCRGGSSRYALDFRESLAFFQSYRSNFSYSFSPQKSVTVFDDPIIALRGGGGEMLRSTNTSLAISRKVSDFVSSADISDSSNVENLVRWYMNSGRLAQSGEQPTERVMRGAFGAFSGSTVVEIMNAHYFNTRNRAHFGHIRFSHASNEVAFHFLSNGYFKRAAELSSFEDRVNGEVARAIFRRTSPQLLSYPFENDGWTQKLASAPLRTVSGSDERWTAELDALRGSVPNSKPAAGWGARQRGVHTDYEPDVIQLSFIKRAFSLIESRVPEGRREELSVFHEEILSVASASSLHLSTLVAKAASAVDVFYPIIRKGNSVRLSCRPAQGKPSSAIRSARADFLDVPQDGWNNIPFIEFSPTIMLTAEGILVEVNVAGTSSLGSSFAYYLFRDGKRVDTVWYSSRSSALFEKPSTPGRYSALVFARTEADGERVLKVRTNQLQIR
ncbi:hypothetical protein [Corynebacterium halotolerans]|uniref:hypothetical protein n=1 Tax=Corynebacterium halotolerans TaxID=225326 RepID=UPI003CF88BD7